MRLSVTARITLLSIALALVSNLVLVGFVWKQTHDEAIGAVRRETVERSDELSAVWRREGLSGLKRAVAISRAPGDVSLIAAVLGANGDPLAGHAPSRLTMPLRPTAFRIRTLAPGGAEAGYALRPVGRAWLLTGRSLDVMGAEERAIGRALGVVVLLSLALGVAAGLVVARYVARRLDSVVAVVEAAGEGNLSARVPVLAADDAFDRLAVRLNATLSQVERLMSELRVVTDSLAHDLRSPLARLRTKAEGAVLIADPEARDAALGGLLAETDLVMAMLTTVIEISRSEATSRDRFSTIEPAALIGAIAELYEPVVEEAELAFHLDVAADCPPMPLHRELLSQAVANLIDNAVKHAAAGGEVTLRLVCVAQGIAVQVEDRGPGIAAADREQAVKRFGRLDSARTTPGAGLGMALVESVARLHGGALELADNRPGLIARLVLPAS